MDLGLIADGWIRYWRAAETLGDVTDLGAKEAVADLVHEDPDRALSVILKVVERIEPLPTTTLFQVLAAGPLEDLLAHHGPAIIDRVEAHARRDERFDLLLGGVWRNGIASDVWRPRAGLSVRCGYSTRSVSTSRMRTYRRVGANAAANAIAVTTTADAPST